MEELKTCRVCGLVETEDDPFPMTTKRGQKRKRGYCRTCWRAYMKKYRDSMKSSDVTRYRRTQRNDALRRYGITIAKYDDMLASQGGGCAICGTTKSQNGKRLQVDHCHETGKVRGLLCHGCNTSLGGFGDDPKRLKSAIDYLEMSRIRIAI